MADAPLPTTSHRAEYYSLRFVVGLLHALPWNVACGLGERLGALGYAPLGIRRRVVERQIAAAFPEKPEAEVHELARRAYEHLGRSSIETALLPSIGKQGVLDMVEDSQGFELVEQAIAQGKGAVLVTGHLGNWELAGAYVAARGVPMDVIVRTQANPLFDAYINETRGSLGMTVVRDFEAARRTPRSLREGRAVAFVSDQGVMGLASTFVTFFGRPAKTPRGAAVFAMKYDTPTLFVTALRQPSGRYRVSVEKVPVVRTGDREHDVDTIVAAYTDILERWVRTAPEQYFWQHRRWRRQPDDTPPELRDPSL
ncbi:MAG: lysophospholipid acyltransferase family protein [Gemmatimonadota bacterium]|nr:lysophospholipid acyltransferase family protein [Gemmatimonadota bacterium]